MWKSKAHWFKDMKTARRDEFAQVRRGTYGIGVEWFLNTKNSTAPSHRDKAGSQLAVEFHMTLKITINDKIREQEVLPGPHIKASVAPNGSKKNINKIRNKIRNARTPRTERRWPDRSPAAAARPPSGQAARRSV